VGERPVREIAQPAGISGTRLKLHGLTVKVLEFQSCAARSVSVWYFRLVAARSSNRRGQRYVVFRGSSAQIEDAAETVLVGAASREFGEPAADIAAALTVAPAAKRAEPGTRARQLLAFRS
jgi:hypothetical protein